MKQYVNLKHPLLGNTAVDQDLKLSPLSRVLAPQQQIGPPLKDAINTRREISLG